MQAATWRCDANDVAVATAAAAVRRSDVGELHVCSMRPTMARCDAWKKRRRETTATISMLSRPPFARTARRCKIQKTDFYTLYSVDLFLLPCWVEMAGCWQ